MILFIRFSFYISHPIVMCYLVILWLASSNIQEFPSVYGHKCWSVPTKSPPFSPQAGIRIHEWTGMRWPMSSHYLWVFFGDYYYRQHNASRCSGYKKYPDSWTTLASYWNTVSSHRHLSPRCHMVSLSLWYNLDPSLHEYGSFVHQLIQKWHHNSLYLLPIKLLLRRLSVNILWKVPPFLNNRHCKTPDLS